MFVELVQLLLIVNLTKLMIALALLAQLVSLHMASPANVLVCLTVSLEEWIGMHVNAILARVVTHRMQQLVNAIASYLATLIIMF